METNRINLIVFPIYFKFILSKNSETVFQLPFKLAK